MELFRRKGAVGLAAGDIVVVLLRALAADTFVDAGSSVVGGETGGGEDDHGALGDVVAEDGEVLKGYSIQS